VSEVFVQGQCANATKHTKNATKLHAAFNILYTTPLPLQLPLLYVP
jgi:hypothetical protein